MLYANEMCTKQSTPVAQTNNTSPYT